VPHVLAADAAFYSGKNEAAAKGKGVNRVCIPNRSTKSPERKREQKKRWFRNAQKWRTGCKGRISVAKRRHGLNRYLSGRGRHEALCGLGVIADNLINIGRAIQNEGDLPAGRIAVIVNPPGCPGGFPVSAAHVTSSRKS
jgi:IS5 family transposase